MKPQERYQIRKSTATRKWRVIDIARVVGQGNNVRVLVDGLTEKAAWDVKQAVCAAFMDGANAVKTGEIIL